MKRVPALETAGIAHTVCGPESFTPDHKPLMGQAPELPGFWLNCGFNSSGIMLSGGCGEALSQWIVDGQPEIDMFSYDVSRFHPSMTATTSWLEDRSQEAYAKNYAVVYPHDQPLASRGMRKTPFHDQLISDGCVHQEVFGWERPLYFVGPGGESTEPKAYDYYGAYSETPAHESHRYFDLLKHEYSFDWPSTFTHIRAQHEATRDRVAAFDMSAFGKIAIDGPDAQAAMDWISMNRVDQGPGRVAYTELLDARGGIQSDLTITCTAENEFYVVTPGASFQHDWMWIENSIREKGFEVRMKDITEDFGVLSVQGRHARRLLQNLTDADLDDAAFPFGTFQNVTLAGAQVRMLRLTFVGELGWELHVPRERCAAVYDAVFSAGRPFGIVNAGYSAIESLSLEKGYKHWHQDVRPTDTPLEAGLGFAVKLKTDTPFQGREALERQKRDGLRKRSVFVYPEENVPIFGLEALFRDGRPCGFLRRGGYAFSLERPVGVGYVLDPDAGVVDQSFLKSGHYELDVMGRRYKCDVSTRTPFDPKNLRVKGIYESAESGASAEPGASKPAEARRAAPAQYRLAAAL